MDSFFDQFFFNNTIRNYTISAGIIMAVLVFRRILGRWTAALISRLLTSKQRAFNRQRFQALVLEPIQFFLLVLAVIIALDRLSFPMLRELVIYKTNLHDVIESVGRTVLIGSFIWLCNRMILYTAELLQEKALETPDRADDQLVIFLRDFLKVLVWIIGVLLILKYSFGFDLGHVLTGLSIVGAAMALAFRESLENLIASFIIFFDRPFTIGDIVKVENVTGTIERIGLRSTRIRTTEKTYTTVPNKKMVDTIIDNQTLRLQRNVTTRLEMSLSATPVQLSTLVSLIESELAGQENILDWNVYFSDTGASSHVIHVEYFVTMELPIKQFFKLRENINLRVLHLMKECGVELAGANPGVVIHHAAPNA